MLLCLAVQTFPGAWSFLQNSRFPSSVIAARGPTANLSSGVEKTVLYIVCFAYSLLLAVLLALVLTLLSY